jgi:hypothetical protein
LSSGLVALGFADNLLDAAACGLGDIDEDTAEHSFDHLTGIDHARGDGVAFQCQCLGNRQELTTALLAA